MLIVTVPRTMEIGDSVEVRINGKERMLELSYDSILLDGVERKLVAVKETEVGTMLIAE